MNEDLSHKEWEELKFRNTTAILNQISKTDFKCLVFKLMSLKLGLKASKLLFYTQFLAWFFPLRWFIKTSKKYLILILLSAQTLSTRFWLFIHFKIICILFIRLIITKSLLTALSNISFFLWNWKISLLQNLFSRSFWTY